ncbi:MAG: AAA family ATPase [Chromatiaceae bacterium]|nr:AAA family ATPase [Chromatiaceae bacterium]
MQLPNTAHPPRTFRRMGPPPPSSPADLRRLQERLTTPPDPDRARAALWSVPADLPREDWVRIGMAAQAAGLALEDFDTWSASAPDCYDPRAVRDTWKSFKGAGIGPGTLFHAARAHGWQEHHHAAPPRQEAPPPQAAHPGALAVWDRCPPAPADHPYIMAKGGTPEGLRVVPASDPLTIAGQRLAGALAVPAYDAAGNLQTIQFIPAPGTGKKMNLPGATLSGAVYTLGAIQPGRPCYLVEGIGQAWACHQATGEAAVCCFGWGNVKTIAAALAPAGPALVIVPDVGKEIPAATLAREVGAAVACLPAGLPGNYDVNDYAQAEGPEALRALLEAVEMPAPDRTRPPAPAELIPTEAELAAARLAPRCVVRDHSYADVAVLVAPGGTGKTTLLIHEAVHIALGWPVWGLPVDSPGWTLLVTAEDRREQVLARLREILATLDLTPDERAVAIQGVRVWDVTGEAVKLVHAMDGNVILSGLADAIVATYRDDAPAVVVFDPLVSFGASEGLVNDNEQGIIAAARRIVKGLDCCVRVVHHTGKANARLATLDQYSARGGSALPDGSRMTTVLQTWRPEEAGGLHPPPGCQPGPDASITVMARAKLSYAPPNLPLIWIRREGFAFEHFLQARAPEPEVQRADQADQLERFIAAELEVNRRHNATSLGTMADRIGLSREAIRRALQELRVSGRIVETPLPRDLCQGSRKNYLNLAPNSADADGRVPPAPAPDPGQSLPPATTRRPYRDGTLGRVVPRDPDPPSLNSAAEVRQSTAELAEYTDCVGIIPADDEEGELVL